MLGGRLDWRQLSDGGGNDSIWTFYSLCKVLEVLFSLEYKKRQPNTLFLPLCRIFSLHIPLAPKTFVSFVYKPPVGVNISLELKTIDGPLCTFDGMEEIACEWSFRLCSLDILESQSEAVTFKNVYLICLIFCVFS